MLNSSLYEELSKNAYPGRGIYLAKSKDAKKAVIAYFIMGRSENSRNRIFMEEGDGIRTKAFDESKLTDPSLIIYSPVKVFRSLSIVTNGDQTDTIYEGLEKGLSFEESLRSRSFEPDAPNYTPRISGLLDINAGKMSYKISILKSVDGNPKACQRFFFEYDNPLEAEGHFIHTYAKDGEVLESFHGEPKRLAMPDENIDKFADNLWASLDEDNKVSLFVRYIDIATSKCETRIINKHN